MNMNTYDNKFKERNPTDTIQIVRDFFESRGYSIQVTDNIDSEAETNSCHVTITLGNYTVLSSNGKGITKDFSWASGYAELYERFANRLNLYLSPILYDQYIQQQFQHNGFHVAPDEKVMTAEEILYNSKLMSDFYLGFAGTEQGALDLINIFNNNSSELYGVPYKNLIDGSIKYYNQPALYRVCTSNGMASGNTEDEALNQGLSELFERWGIEKFFTEPQKCYYEIDLNTLTDNYLKERFNKIKDKYGVHLYDLSYNFDIPVMMLMLSDPSTHRIYINFGSFPVVGIAIERTLTEVYQGFKTFEEDGTVQIPGREMNGYAKINLDGNSTIGMICLPEEVFFNSQLVSYNESVFLSNENYHNDIILKEYFINLCKKLNLNIYYRNNTLTPKMAAIQAFCDNVNMQNVKVPYYEDYTLEHRQSLLADIKHYSRNANIIVNDMLNGTLSLDIYNKLHTIPRYNEERQDGEFLGSLYMNEWTCISQFIIKCCGALCWYVDLYNSPLMPHELFSKEQNGIIKRFQTLQAYTINNNYTNEEIKSIFKTWNDTVTDLDLEECFNPSYIFYRAYLENEAQFVKLGYFKTMIKSHFEKENLL